MTKQTEKTALKKARDAITEAIAEGNRPDIADIVLVEHLKGNKTFWDRVQATWFPLLVVSLAMLLLGIMATHHPPVVRTKGHIQTTVVDLRDLAATPRDIMVLADATERTRVRIFGAQAADADGCVLRLDSAELRFETTSFQALLDGMSGLRLEVAPRLRVSGQPDEQVDLLAEVSTALDIEALDVRSVTTADGGGTCPDADSLILKPQSGEAMQIFFPVKGAAALPQLLRLPQLKISMASFALADLNFGRPDCAILSAKFEIVQEIPYLGLSATKPVELPRGACLSLPADLWSIELAGLETGRLEVTAKTSTGAVIDIDDGSDDVDLKQTYLEVVSADPNIAMIFGAIVFVLTTVWGAAAFVREVVS